MTAIRVVDDHNELANSGMTSHSDLDQLYQNTQFLIGSGSSFIPAQARQLVAGPGIIIVDNGPGSTLEVKIDPLYVVTYDSPVIIGNSISWNDTPFEIVDGTNVTYTFTYKPSPPTAIMLYYNGVIQKQGVDSDFILSGNTVTFVNGVIPRAGSNITATYPY